MTFLATAACVVALTACPEPADPDSPVWSDVQPILQDHCSSCHGGDAGGSGGLAFTDSYEDVMADSIASVCSGSSRADCIAVRVDDGSMPLDGCALDSSDDCISSSDLAELEAWLDGGAAE